MQCALYNVEMKGRTIFHSLKFYFMISFVYINDKSLTSFSEIASSELRRKTSDF